MLTSFDLQDALINQKSLANLPHKWYIFGTQTNMGRVVIEGTKQEVEDIIGV